MEAVAKLRNCPMSARKMRLGADLVRNKPVGEALSILQYSGREAGIWLEKLLLSAVANWENKLDNTESADDFDLRVSMIMVDQGPMIKRFRPAPQGRAHRIRKHSNHVTLAVTNAVPLSNEVEGAVVTSEATTNPA
ncbi:MAG: 50S ribosomal protein L22 [Saprospiraceae bacterium]